MREGHGILTKQCGTPARHHPSSPSRSHLVPSTPSPLPSLAAISCCTPNPQRGMSEHYMLPQGAIQHEKTRRPGRSEARRKYKRSDEREGGGLG